MGCCGSRPADSNGEPHLPSDHPPLAYTGPATSSTRAINSTSAIVAPSSTSQSQHLQPPSLVSRGTASRSNLSTPRHSISRPFALHEHYNAPLQLPAPWRSTDRTWTYSQLERERAEFFETRVTGHQEVWGALQQVSELLRIGELATAQGILEAAGVTTPTGNLIEGCYDEAGNFYKLPETIILDPINVHPDEARNLDPSNIDGDTVVGTHEGKSEAMEHVSGGEREANKEEDAEARAQRREDKGKESVRDAMKVRCRLSDRGGPDVVILLGKSQTVGSLTRRCQSEAEVPTSLRIRMAYLGRMLDETQSLLSQGWKEGHVINALVTGPAAEKS